MLDTNIAETTDLGLAAALVSTGYQLRDIQFKESGQGVFHFEEEEGISDDIDSYWRGKLEVSALEMNHNIRALKSRVVSRK